MLSDSTMEKVRNLAEAPIEAVFTDPNYGKVTLHAPFFLSRCAFNVLEVVFIPPSHAYNSFFIYVQFERGEALDKITQDVRRVLEEECDEESLKVLPKAVDTVRKKV